MKIGILGSSLESLYLASYFADLEAHVSLFGELDPLQTYEYYKEELDQGYWFDLLEKLQGRVVYTPSKVNRIQKSFIQSDEDLPRMKDTFRVVTEKEDMEYFEDFDFLIECHDLSKSYSFLGGDAPAIHEKKHARNELGYYNESDVTEEVISKMKGSVGIVGDFTGEPLLQSFLETLDEADNELHFFQNEDAEFLLNYEQNFKKQIDSFDKTKDPEPQRKVFQYPLSTIVSLDYMDDRERLYITSEIPDFRSQDEHFTSQKIRTVAVDYLLHFRTPKQSSGQFLSFILENEAGYYKINGGEWKNLSQLQAKAEEFKDAFLQYFTKV